MAAIASNVIAASELPRQSHCASRADRRKNTVAAAERLNWLLDRDSPLLELSRLCGLGLHEDDGADNINGGGQSKR